MSVILNFAGDLILAREERPGRFAAFFEYCANQPRMQRLLLYKMFNALVLTSHAHRTESSHFRKELFALKNKIYLDLATDPKASSALVYTHLKSGKVHVRERCANCSGKDTYCAECSVDKEFFDVLSMEFKYQESLWRIFLSSELMKEVQLKPTLTLKRKGIKERGKLGSYTYTGQNLHSIALESALAMHERILNKRF